MDPIAFIFASEDWAFAADDWNRIAVVAIKAWQSRRVRLFMGCLLFAFGVQPFCGRYDRTVLAPAQDGFVPICSLSLWERSRVRTRSLEIRGSGERCNWLARPSPQPSPKGRGRLYIGFRGFPFREPLGSNDVSL